jgi:O-antigen ligase
MVACGGLAIAATLRAILGVAVALPIACIAGAARRVAPRRALFAALGAVALACAAVTALKGSGIADRVRTSWHEVHANVVGTHGGNTGTRVYWLKAGIWAARERPVLGWGTGATPRAIGAYPGRADMEKASSTAFPEGAAEPGHPHSIYLMALIESGPVGLGLLVALAIVVIATLARSARGPASVGFLAFGVVWFVAAGFDTVFNFSTMSALALAVALGTFTPQSDRTCAC